MTNAAFDGLAAGYSGARPHYPREIMAALGQLVHRGERATPIAVVDVGAGTGISLRGLSEVLGDQARYTAIDVSADMIEQGKRNFPAAHWVQVHAEPYLETQRGLDLVLAAQTYHWLDQPRFLAAATLALAPGGTLAILYNNRLDSQSAFLDVYEALLESYSYDYRRDYRHGDLRPQLRAYLPQGTTIDRVETEWERRMSAAEFLQMSRSSTRTQRAVTDHGDEFLDRLVALVEAEAAAHDGVIAVPYRTELTTAQFHVPGRSEELRPAQR